MAKKAAPKGNYGMGGGMMGKKGMTHEMGDGSMMAGKKHPMPEMHKEMTKKKGK